MEDRGPLWRRLTLGQGGNAPTPSHMVAVQGGALASTGSGIGGGAVAAVSLPKVSLRNATTMEVAKWQIALDNVLILYGLDAVAKDGEPPSRLAVHKAFPDLSTDEVDERFVQAMRQYQEENTKYPLFFGRP